MATSTFASLGLSSYTLTQKPGSACALGKQGGSLVEVPSCPTLAVRQRGYSIKNAAPARYVVLFSAESDVAVTEGDDEHGAYPSGEWPANFSMSNYEDLSLHHAPAIFKTDAQPSTMLFDVMAKNVWTARAEDTLAEVQHHFDDISGVPVVDASLKCIGVLSKKDIASKDATPETKVGDIMTTPPITITVDKTVQDAAVVMLKDKVHRIPVVNDAGQVVGIVTRTDIFSALEELPAPRKSE